MTRRNWLALAMAGLLAGAPAAATPPAQYHVRVSAQIGDAPLSSPSLYVEAGRPATFMVANDRYRMSIIATPAASGQVAVRSELDLWTPEGLRRMETDVTIPSDGTPATLFSADPSALPGGRVRVQLSVVPATP